MVGTTMWQQLSRLREFGRCACTLGPDPVAASRIFWHETKNVRVRWHLARYRPQHTYVLTTTYGRLWFRDNFGDVTNLVNLYLHGVYDVPALAHGVILDVGANIGLAAARFTRRFPGRTIYCFEPLAANAALIQHNCPSAHVVCVAVGAGRGRVRLQVDPDSVMASQIPCRWRTTTVEFDTLSLDEFARDQAIDEVALLKIDVEGMELAVLRGGEGTLSHTHQVVMETHGARCHSETRTFLRSEGFAIGRDEYCDPTGILFASRPEARH